MTPDRRDALTRLATTFRDPNGFIVYVEDLAAGSPQEFETVEHRRAYLRQATADATVVAREVWPKSPMWDSGRG